MTTHESMLRERLDNAIDRLRAQGRHTRAWLVNDRWTDWQSRRQWAREQVRLV